ncbi:hypothetical protein OSTOST_12307 [Ostertagia ostertagi]
MPSLTNGDAPTCEDSDSGTSHSFHSQSTAVVSDSVTDDDAEFEREMRLMLMGHHPQTIYSRKVFLGGLPSYSNSGYAFAIFASADSVVSLINSCANFNGKYSISTPVCGSRHATIHIRVWLNRDAKYCSENSVDFMDNLTKNAVFVGGLPRTVTAKELFDFMSLAFGDVIMTQIEVEVETDYPKGAGCVVFRDRDSFLVAIARRFISFKVTDCYKKVELKPYLMRLTQCDICQKTRARNFCPQLRCLKYMCEPCWQRAHMDLDNLSGHLPMVRSPPIRTRFSTNNASIPCNNHKIHDGISGRAQNKVMEVSEKAEANARNLYRFLNSLPITPMPSLECDSEPSRDWNTDCGLFDGRGPPPHYGSRLVTNTVQPSARRCNFKKTGSESYSRQNSHLPNQRWNGGSENTVEFYSTALAAGGHSWSDRISAFADTTYSRPVVMSHLNHFVRARTSFSPTIRRPNRRPCNTQAHKPTNITNNANKDLSDNVALLVSQFQLF